MAIIIQKLANIVNIVDSDAPVGNQIITSIELSSTAKLQLKGGTIPNLVQFWDDEGNQTGNVSITPDLQTQDEGAAAQPWIGTDDELINKLNNEYLTEQGGGGSSAVDATIVADNVGLAKEDKQDDRIAQETCKEAFYTITNNGGDSSDLVGNFEFTYWDGATFVTYSEDVDGLTFNDIDELVAILNANQSFFVFANPPANLLPTEHNQNLLIRSGTVDLVTGFQQGSFVLESNDGPFDDSYNFAGSVPAESNTDKIVINQERILESQNIAYQNNQIVHQRYINPSNLSFPEFKRLSFVCSGAITVTINATPIIYPFTIGSTEIIGNTYEVDVNVSIPVVFDGTGELVVTLLN